MSVQQLHITCVGSVSAKNMDGPVTVFSWFIEHVVGRDVCLGGGGLKSIRVVRVILEGNLTGCAHIM